MEHEPSVVVPVVVVLVVVVLVVVVSVGEVTEVVVLLGVSVEVGG
jgi:hypothetical protein